MSDILTKSIRKIRESKGYSQEYMAQEMNLSQRAYSKIENCETKLDWEKLKIISKILEIEIGDLINYDKNSKINHHDFKHTSSSDLAVFISLYEDRILRIEKEMDFLREIVLNNTQH
ncbi:helix-turn-helix transcriptional regulator [Empedobacter tilapiae]|uniref:XRE family transcriptional regulator n=1 Tax=Empedobacter tilapiae TaxID=2491114 RepID=A0A4Z1BSC8_9FLAO|nr:helix-turn-helix transcriptional regulator [Empedobacter tilapiae]TGN26702.1 XRE family transcriptional regulator [Empedobacter tilapiae]